MDKGNRIQIVMAAALLLLGASAHARPLVPVDASGGAAEAAPPVPPTPGLMKALPNLDIVTFTGPLSAQQGENFAGGITLVIRNSGDTPISTAFQVRIYLSQDVLVDASDQSIGSYNVPAGLAAHATRTVPFASVSASLLSLTGPLYLAASVDAARAIAESDETDNIGTVPITIIDVPETYAYLADFQDGPAGWTSVDYSVVQTSHLYRTTYNDGSTLRGVWWCGEDDPSWTTAPGYGDNWNQGVIKAFSLPSAGPITLDYQIQYDSEPDYDVTHVEISTDGGLTYQPLAAYSGSSAGAFLAESVNLDAYAGLPVWIRFRFASDVSYSDEDGGYPSDGAFRLDYVQVTGYPPDQFETGDDGWTVWLPTPVGGEFRLEAEPACTAAMACDSYGNGNPAIGCNAWVAYDPGTLTLPLPSVYDRLAGQLMRVAIESPEITIPPGTTRTTLVFDVNAYLPLNNYVFYRWYVSCPPYDDWVSDSFLTYSTSGSWQQRTVNMTSYLAPGATALKVRLALEDHAGTYGTPTGVSTPAPFFDNVRILVEGAGVAGLDGNSFPRPCGWRPEDADADGVLGLADACPGEASTFFDRDGDGCLDPVRGGRHVEYWAQEAFPVGYVVHEEAAPGITDGSDVAAIQAGFAAWEAVPGADVALSFLGTTAQADARSLDFQNLVTFSDPDFVFPSGVIAVGLSTSFTTPEGEGAGFRPGQIVDADMLFNPAMSFRTATTGSGTDIQSVVTHEAGHMLGLSHSAVVTSTMYYVLPPQTSASVLAMEDELAMLRAYPDAGTLAGASHLRGRVLGGVGGLPVPGVIVFAIAASTGDTLGCDFTLPADGSYDFVALPDGEYYVAIHALDGTSRVGYLEPANINHLIYAAAETAIVPEWWDAAESRTDDPAAKSALAVTAGVTTIADLVTNVDVSGPTVAAVTPAPDATGVAIDAAIMIRFSEALDSESLRGNFTLALAAGGSLLPGNAALVEDGQTLAYVPAANLEFATAYRVELGPGIRDLFGNSLGTRFTLDFTTQPRPPVSISSLAPSKGVAGSVVAIGGAGFSPDPAGNAVSFGAVTVPVSQASTGQLVFAVPTGAQPGNVEVRVTNLDMGSQSSNPLNFTILAPDAVVRGIESDALDLFAQPRALEIAPDGVRAFVATRSGLVVVDVNGSSGEITASLPVPAGLDALAVTPDGQMVWAVSTEGRTLCRIATQPAALLSETPLSAAPRGIVVDPAGRRAYVPTDEGQIQVWDVQVGSATFERQIGALIPTDANLLGKLATNPAGDRLLALTGTGKVLAFDLSSGSSLGEIITHEGPRDVIVDPAGSRAYVTHDSGYLSVVSMGSLTKITDIRTGGTLRGAALTPSGTFVYAANHQLNDLDVIDLREGSPTYRTLAARIPQPTNPVDVAFSPDGMYACAVVESASRLVITATGAGPLLTSLSPPAGPAGAKVVLSGSGFTGASVSFNGIGALIERARDDAMTVTVPPGARSGPVTVIGSGGGRVSNPQPFTVLDATDGGGLRLAAVARPAGEPPLSAALVASPRGDLVVAGGGDGRVHVLDTNPGSNRHNRFVADIAAFGGAVSGLAVAPDATVAYAVSGSDPDVAVLDIAPGSGAFGTVTGRLALDGTGPSRVVVSPDGLWLAIADPGAVAVHLLEADGGAKTTVSLAGALPGLSGVPGALAYHPGGGHLYVAVRDASPAAVVVLDVGTPGAAGFGAVTGAVTLPAGSVAAVPASLCFTPDGLRCLVWTVPETGGGERGVTTLATSSPASPTVGSSLAVATTATTMDEAIRVSPAGDLALANVRDDGLLRLGLAPLSSLGGTALAGGGGPLDIVWAPDARRAFVLGTQDASLLTFDFLASQQIAKIWGDGQAGVAGEALPAPLRVRVTDVATGKASSGVPVAFEILSGGGGFVAPEWSAAQATVTVATDSYGYAQATWRLGSDSGPQETRVSSLGVSGSPLTYAATAVEDPQTLPLSLVTDLLAPAGGATGVSITTAVQAVFSRPFDRQTTEGSAFYLSADGGATEVPATCGYADGDRRLSLTPAGPLAYDATYTLVVGAQIRDLDGGPLTNPAAISFTTEPAPAAPAIAAVQPPSAAPAVDVVISGAGFSPMPSGNVVRFGGTRATVVQSAPDYILASVPPTAESGSVTVEVAGATSNEVPFTVLVPRSSPADDVIAQVGTGSATKSVTVSPDGTVVYAVSPEADLIVPIALRTLTTLPGIAVGDEPWAIAVHPDGSYAYVANRRSGDVSVVDIRPQSPSRHAVVGTLQVGDWPVDIAVTPSGDRVIVANSGSRDLSIIDADRTSDTFHRVIASAPTGSSTRAVTVSPDGGRIFVGTENGYLVMGALNYGVLERVNTGAATKTVTVSPDGTLLILVSTQGDLAIIDIVPGSDRENQVIATVSTTSAVKTTTVSPDGALLFVLLEDEDMILVFRLDPGRAGWALAPDAAFPAVQLQLVATISAGENPQAIAFDPTGSGQFVVANAGDNTVTVFGDIVVTEGEVKGRVTANCPPPGRGLRGVELDLFANGTGDLVTTAQTDSLGYYASRLPAGGYTLTIVTPLGYRIAMEEAVVALARGDTCTVNWPLLCETIVPNPRKMSFWKHQLGLALSGRGQPEIDAPTLCAYLDIIEAHFNSNELNPVVVYMPPASGLCQDKLQVAKDLLNLDGDSDVLAQARQELLSLLFNVAGGKLSLASVVSSDGAVVSQAVTYVDRLIDDELPGNDELARRIAKDVNQGKLIGARIIPAGTPNIAYLPRAGRFSLGQAYPNPFNPMTRIRYEVAWTSHVRLRIYDLAGGLVCTLVDEELRPGAYTAVWDGTVSGGRPVAAGVYFCRLEAGDFVKTRKLTLLK